MIYIDRTKVARPNVLKPEENPEIKKEYAAAKRFFGGAEHQRGQRRFQFKVYLNRQVRAKLNELFHGKCAYCEQRLPKDKRGTGGDIELYRPSKSVLEAPDHPGYWWLTTEWKNLLIACSGCNRGVTTKMGSSGKANRFPLKDETKRVDNPSGKLANEEPLLLNPCKDQPLEHLVFTDDGMVNSTTERGKATIMVCGLNRMDLVFRRKEAIDEILHLKGLITRLIDLPKSTAGDADLKHSITRLKAWTEESAEFAALKRQYVRAAMEEFGLMDEEVDLKEKSRSISMQEQKQTKKSYSAYTESLENISMSSASDDRSDYLLQEHYVEKIELTNIKTFSEQTFELTNSEGSSAPWMMLLGENGAGKSTVLKSLSLVLCDAHYFQELIKADLVDPNKFIRHGTKKGTIKVWLSGNKNPRILTLKKDHFVYTSPQGDTTEIILPMPDMEINTKAWQAQTFILAYGATRLLPRGNKGEAKCIVNKYGRVDNLFNPFVPLSDAKEWMLSLDKKLFRRAAIILKDVLNMGEDEEMVIEDGEIMVVVNASKQPFSELSDGYQSVVALVTDVLQLVMSEWRNPDEARGIVLLDEVGAHLHPRWKMRIVDSLRKALPHMQFIVSTHQPLCLRGIGKGEVVIMRRDEAKRVEVLTDLPDPKELKISQILTSIFGLSSTLDPEIEADYNRFNTLRAKHNRSPDEEEEMQDLRIQLKPHLLLGDTLLDVQTYQVVKEEYNQHKKLDENSDVESLSEKTLSAVQSLWNKKS